MTYTKNDLLEYFATQYQLAKFLGITHQAVYRWPFDKPIPELRQLQLEKREHEWKTRKFIRIMQLRARPEHPK